MFDKEHTSGNDMLSLVWDSLVRDRCLILVTVAKRVPTSRVGLAVVIFTGAGVEGRQLGQPTHMVMEKRYPARGTQPMMELVKRHNTSAMLFGCSKRIVEVRRRHSCDATWLG